jgi:hypothetical protein
LDDAVDDRDNDDQAYRGPHGRPSKALHLEFRQINLSRSVSAEDILEEEHGDGDDSTVGLGGGGEGGGDDARVRG